MPETDDPKDTVVTETPQTAAVGAEQVVAPTVAPRRRGFSVVAGGAVAAVFGFGLAQFVPQIWPAPATDQLVADVAVLKADLAALQATVAQTPPPDMTLADRVIALENAPALAMPDTAALEGRIAALETAPDIADSGGGVNVATSVLAAQAKDIAALQADVAALKAGGAVSPDIDAMLAKAEARAAELAAQTEADAQTLRQRAALDRLEVALESGAPFATALADLGDAPLPAVLADNAAIGLPTLATLQAAFPDAARAALDASLVASGGQTWGERATSFLRNQTGARSLTPREGTDPDAILSRAEAALAVGDVPVALTELAALPAEAQAVLADWLALTSAQQSAQKAVADLRTALNLE